MVGYDGSDHARRALERAAELASPGDEVLVVGAVEPKLEPETHGAHQDPSESEHRRKSLEDAKAFLADKEVKVDTVEAYGDPGSAIVAAAKDADLIVVGSRGATRSSGCCSGPSAPRSSTAPSRTSSSSAEGPQPPPAAGAPARSSPARSRRSRSAVCSSGLGSHCAGSGSSSSERRPNSLRNSGVVR